ncbi:DUF1648 domain-containing protein [Winogradskyella haliclonae]|uniref:DUF1648 domain-containing protein n=1 Tax=Winogradskyella haliclonae TaxID=2048558 RepID=A0ABQ2BX90_9FLAO|nr:DUF1648 domain-containing protein [Winogradskyella haliclonae]GGI57075.1 hypothetical protein GCM10011444_13840 [Winogradskyella haliclonae]
MKNDRPKIKVPFETLDIVIELASIAILILMWCHVIIEYGNLPDSIPSHFNASGEPDGYSKKLFLWFLPSLATVMYLGMLALSRFPHLHNYTVNITKENALKQYRFSTRVLRIVNFLCTLLFAYISYKIIVGAQQNASSLGVGFPFIVVGACLLLVVVIIIYQKKNK